MRAQFIIFSRSLGIWDNEIGVGSSNVKGSGVGFVPATRAVPQGASLGDLGVMLPSRN